MTQDENKLPTFDCFECTEHNGGDSQRDEGREEQSWRRDKIISWN
jgi:hypothetical protein